MNKTEITKVREQIIRERMPDLSEAEVSRLAKEGAKWWKDGPRVEKKPYRRDGRVNDER